MKDNYKLISEEAFKLNGVFMNDGQFMDAEKRKIVFTVVNTMFSEHKLIAMWLSNELMRPDIESILLETIIKTLNKSATYKTGHGYWLWRKSKMTKYGNLEEFIMHIFHVAVEDNDLVNKIINK